MRPRPLLGSKAWYGPARWEYSHSPASPEGHAVAVVAIAAAPTARHEHYASLNVHAT